MHIGRRIRLLLSSRVPAITWSILIFILLALPGNMLPDEKHFNIPGLDKLVHIILFGFFVFLWSFYYACNQGRIIDTHLRYLKIAFIACIYGTFMEFVQKYFIPNRNFDVFDILADVLGAAAGYILVLLTVSHFKNNASNILFKK